MSVHDNKDFISDMACNHDRTTLLATRYVYIQNIRTCVCCELNVHCFSARYIFSGDGTLSAFDLRQKRLEQRSDPSESELLSLAIVKVSVCPLCKVSVCPLLCSTITLTMKGAWANTR